jgi:hypothetical protein
MALKEPKRLSPGATVRVCWLAIIAPDKFEEFERKFDLDLNDRPDDKRRRLDFVRRGYWEAMIWMITALVIGGVIGIILRSLGGPAPFAAALIAICGTAILLWATLSFQGWPIQSYSDTTLTERVNRWLYRFLYALGTCLLVSAAVWQLT